MKERIYNFCTKFNIKNILMGISIYPYDGTSANKLLRTAHERLENYQENIELNNVELSL